MRLPALLDERGFSLRAACDDDLHWLCDLYATTRAAEMAQVAWPDPLKRSFLDQQFALQHAHYMSHFGGADFMALDGPAGPAGRCYLQRNAPEHLLIDLSLFPAWRGQGVGAALIRQAQADARALARGMRLHVLHSNHGARRLYERLGFIAEAASGSHLPMRWQPAD